MKKLTAFIRRNAGTKIVAASIDSADTAYTRSLTRVEQKTVYGPAAPECAYETDQPAALRTMPFQAREEQWC